MAVHTAPEGLHSVPTKFSIGTWHESFQKFVHGRSRCCAHGLMLAASAPCADDKLILLFQVLSCCFRCSWHLLHGSYYQGCNKIAVMKHRRSSGAPLQTLKTAAIARWSAPPGASRWGVSSHELSCTDNRPALKWNVAANTHDHIVGNNVAVSP